jgi:hypothetical protein
MSTSGCECSACRWGSELAAYRESSEGFVQSLAPFSSFDRILNDGGFTRTPLRTHIAVASSAAIGSTVSELATKPITHALNVSRFEQAIRK